MKNFVSHPCQGVRQQDGRAGQVRRKGDDRPVGGIINGLPQRAGATVAGIGDHLRLCPRPTA